MSRHSRLFPSSLVLGAWLAAAGHAFADPPAPPPKPEPSSPRAEPPRALDAFPSFIAPPRDSTAVPAAPADPPDCPARARHVGPGSDARRPLPSACRAD